MHSLSLANQFLVAMPNQDDSLFNRTVIFVIEHNEEGAMGIVINLPIELDVAGLLEKIEMAAHVPSPSHKDPIYTGGPIGQDKGFVIHSPNKNVIWRNSVSISPDIMVTTSKDILLDISMGYGPDNFLIALGYAGWDKGQLEREIAENAWLTGPASTELIFNKKPKTRWEDAAQHLGVDITKLSYQVGRD